MRVIEKEMLKAVASGKNWSKDNTSVRHASERADDFMPAFEYAVVYLHGHEIATVYHPSTSEEYVTVNLGTLQAWPTRTTMSRLRALGVDVCTRKGVVHLHGGPLRDY